jgi:hypothetical protein
VTDQPGYFAYGTCWSCGNSFTFNPHRVPSIPVDPASGKVTPRTEGGVRQPLCRSCCERANLMREAEGLPPWDVSDDAYGPVEGLPE